MKEDKNFTKNPNTGFTLHSMYFVYAGVLLLAWFFGWVALAVFALLWACAMAFAYYDDKRHAALYVNDMSTSSEADEATSYFFDVGGHCLTCGSKVFVVKPGVTSEQAIIDFAISVEGWKANPEAVAGWMPPGVYCPKGCFNIHATPIPDFGPTSGNAFLADKLSRFEDLYQLAQKLGKHDDVYKKQETFIAYYRRGKRRFLATMLIRNRFECPICKKQIGEAELHFEDPLQPITDNKEPKLWGEPAGRWCAIRRSQFHGILEHDGEAPRELLELFDGVKE